VCPGWVATDMGGTGGRAVADGAAGIRWAATLPETGPTGEFFSRRQTVAVVKLPNRIASDEQPISEWCGRNEPLRNFETS